MLQIMRADAVYMCHQLKYTIAESASGCQWILHWRLEAAAAAAPSFENLSTMHTLHCTAGTD